MHLTQQRIQIIPGEHSGDLSKLEHFWGIEFENHWDHILEESEHKNANATRGCLFWEETRANTITNTIVEIVGVASQRTLKTQLANTKQAHAFTVHSGGGEEKGGRGEGNKITRSNQVNTWRKESVFKTNIQAQSMTQNTKTPKKHICHQRRTACPNWTLLGMVQQI